MYVYDTIATSEICGHNIGNHAGHDSTRETSRHSQTCFGDHAKRELRHSEKKTVVTCHESELKLAP